MERTAMPAQTAPAAHPGDEVVAALMRLRETLVAAGRSLDRVAATVPVADAAPGPHRSTR